jgi:hypothetical protein
MFPQCNIQTVVLTHGLVGFGFGGLACNATSLRVTGGPRDAARGVCGLAHAGCARDEGTVALQQLTLRGQVKVDSMVNGIDQWSSPTESLAYACQASVTLASAVQWHPHSKNDLHSAPYRREWHWKGVCHTIPIETGKHRMGSAFADSSCGPQALANHSSRITDA